MIALALAFALAAQPAGNVEPWTFQAYCYSANLVSVSDLVAYENQRRQALTQGGEAGLNAFVAANPPPPAFDPFARRKLLMRRAAENGAPMDVVDRQVRLFQKNLTALRLVDRARFDRAIADCRTAA